MKGGTRALISLLTAIFWFGYSTVLYPAQIGIIRADGSINQASERAFPLMEKRVKGWLRQEVPELEWVHLSHSNRRFFKHFKKKIELLRLVKSTWKSIHKKGEALELRALKTQLLNSPSNWGALRQNGYFVLAVYSLMQEREEEAQSYIREALRVHPEGRWDWRLAKQPNFDWQSFESLLYYEQSKHTKACNLEMPVDFASKPFRINGFEMQTRKNFSLLFGGRYRLEWAGLPGKYLDLNCRGNSRSQILLKKMDLAQGVPPIQEQSWILIEPKNNSFALYLWTDGIGIDEIPMEEKLTFRQLVNSPLASQLPIAKKKIDSILDKHRRVASTAEMSLQALEPASEAIISVAEPWYTNKAVWLIAGGVALGVLVALLATKERSVTDRHSHAGIKIPIH